MDEFDRMLDETWEAHKDDYDNWYEENKEKIERDIRYRKELILRAEVKDFDRINRIRVSLGALKLR